MARSLDGKRNGFFAINVFLGTGSSDGGFSVPVIEVAMRTASRDLSSSGSNNRW